MNCVMYQYINTVLSRLNHRYALKKNSPYFEWGEFFFVQDKNLSLMTLTYVVVFLLGFGPAGRAKAPFHHLTAEVNSAYDNSPLRSELTPHLKKPAVSRRKLLVLLFIYFIPGPPSWRYRRGPNQAGAALCQTYFCGISSPSQEKSPGHQTHG